MSDRLLRLATLVLALCGAAVAAYLSYTRLTDRAIMCPTTGCETVQRSSYSELAGIPVAYLGVVGYAAIATAASVPGPVARAVGVALTLGAAAFAAYLLVVQLALIHAVCVWCLASDAVVLSLVVVVALRSRGAFVSRSAGRIRGLPDG